MKKRNQVHGHDGHNDGEKQSGKLRKKPAPAAVTKADFRDWRELKDAWARFHLAAKLDTTAQQAAGLIRSMACELFHLHQSLPGFVGDFSHAHELDSLADKLAAELEAQASGKLTNAESELIDAGSRRAFPVPPAGMRADEMAVIDGLDGDWPMGMKDVDLHAYVESVLQRGLVDDEFSQLIDRLEKRGLIEWKQKDGDRAELWHFAGPLEAGLR